MKSNYESIMSKSTTKTRELMLKGLKKYCDKNPKAEKAKKLLQQYT